MENLFLFEKTTFTWSKIYGVVSHSVSMGVVEMYVSSFLKTEQLFRKFQATCGHGYLAPLVIFTVLLGEDVVGAQLGRGPAGLNPCRFYSAPIIQKVRYPNI